MKHRCGFCCVIGLVLVVALVLRAARADEPAFRHLFSFPHDDIITCGDFSEDGKWLVTGSEAGTIRFTDLDKRQHQDIQGAHPFDNGVQALRFTHDGKRLISGGYGRDLQGGLVKVWNTADRSLKATLDAHEGHSVKSLESTADDAFLVTADDRQIAIWNLGTGEKKCHLLVPARAIVVAGRRTLAIGVGQRQSGVRVDLKQGTVPIQSLPAACGDLILYDIEAGKVLQTSPKLAAAGIIACRFRDDRTELLLLSADFTL